VCNNALKVFRKENIPYLYGVVNIYLGNSYTFLASIENTKENCIQAEKAYMNALEIFTKDASLTYYLEAMTGLAENYVIKSQVENRKENLEKAIAKCNDIIELLDSSSVVSLLWESSIHFVTFIFRPFRFRKQRS